MDELERSPIASSPLSVVLTTAGAANVVEDALRDWVTFLNGFERDYEILLANEAPASRVEELAKPYARVRALPAGSGDTGFGAALRRGLEAARHPLVLYARCDPSYKPTEVKQLLKLIDKVDLVAGQRVYPTGSSGQSWTEWAYCWFVRLVFAVRLRDMGCLFLLARRTIFARIPLQSSGIFAHAEVLAKANFLSCLMTDVPIAYRPGAAQSDDLRLRELWTDAHRVLSNPDFGAAVLPEQRAP